MKQTLIQLLPDDIISRDFEAEFWKYSSYSDHTFVSGKRRESIFIVDANLSIIAFTTVPFGCLCLACNSIPSVTC